VWLPVAEKEKRKEKKEKPMTTQEVKNAVNPQLEATPPDAGAPKLTLTQYQQLADSLSADLDSFAAKMPTIDLAPEAIETLLKANRNVPTPAIGSAIAAVAASPALQGTKQLDVDVAREVLQFIEAFRPIQTKLQTLTDQLHLTIETKRAVIGGGVRKIYKVVQTVSTPNDSLAGHARNLKRDFARKRAPKAKQQEGGTPQIGK
jgi:hypothetical protein